MRNFNMHPLDPVFLLLKRVTVLEFFLFLMCAHELLNGFHEFSMYSPTCSSLPPICFAQSWPLGTYIRGRITCFYACNEEFCMGEVPKVSEPFL